MAGNSKGGSIGWYEILARPYGRSLALICTGVWLHAANSLLVTTMMPALVSEIGGAALVSWTISLYEIGTIMTGAAGGLLAMRHGMRLPMGVAAVLFATGCAISASAPAMWVVLMGRLLQGIGGGGMMALSYVAVGVLFPKHLIPRALATVSAIWGVSAFLGPLIGGLFVEYADWRSGFWFFALQSFSLAAWIAFGGALHENHRRDGEASPVSISRIVLLGLGVVLIAGGGVEFAPVRTGSFVLAGIACIIGFLILDGRSGGARLLPSRPLGFGTPTGAALIMILSLSMAAIAITAYGPLLFVMLHGASALVAGYIVACSSIGWTIAAVVVSGSAERHDLKFVAVGMTVVTISILGFLYSVPNGPLWLIAVFTTMEGAGFGMAWTFILRQMTTLAPARETERVAGSIPTIQRLGYAVGAAYAGIVANAVGFADAADLSATASAARAIFASSLPFVALGLAATGRFVILGTRIKDTGHL